jgi:hypothetical protein
MQRHDGSDGARARSARIRAAHDYEATHLDAMRCRSAAPGETERPRWWRSPALSVVRLLARRASRRALDDVGAAGAADAPAGGR